MKALLLTILAAAFITAQAEAKIRLKTATLDSGTQTSLMNLRPNVEPGLYIVEFRGALGAEERAQLSAAGLEIVSYVPDNSFLVKGDKAAVTKFMSQADAKGAVPFVAGLKMEPALAQAGVFAFDRMASLSIALRDHAAGAALAARFGLQQRGTALLEGELSMASAWELAKSSDVLWIERRLAMKQMTFDDGDGEQDPPPPAQPTPPIPQQPEIPVLPITGFESGTKIMNMQAAYAAGFTGTGMITGLSDTGVDSGNVDTLIPDLRGTVVKGSAIALFGSSWGDPQGHGTHVAGSIAGNGAMSDGQIRGGAFGAKLVVQGMWSDLFDNIFPPSMADIFGPAYADGVRTHSNSWGAPASNGRYDNNSAEVDRFMFEHQDFLAVFAAGNDGADLDQDGVIDEGSVSSPGTAKNALTVGASKNLILQGGIQKQMKDLREGDKKWGVEPIASSMLSEDPNGMAAFSSRGPTADGRLKPDVVAPGTNIVSTRSTNPLADIGHGLWNKDYVFMAGTSMATPLTSGAVTVMREILMKRLDKDNVSAALVKATVAHTAHDLFPGQFGLLDQGQEQPSLRPNNHEGWGRVDLNPLVNDGPFHFFDERAGLATDEEKSYDVAVIDPTKPLRFTLAYTDAPGSPVAARSLVNDLDLVVIDPENKRIFPNHGFAADSTNNMEEVDVEAPKAGIYRVRVRAETVPEGINGAQPYALVISGGLL